MGFRFRKSVKLLPGVRLNASSSGFSWTLGGRGASVNVGKRGAFLNTSIPGTGLSSRQRLGTGAKASGPTTPGKGSGNTGKVVFVVLGALAMFAMFGKRTTAPSAAAAIRFHHPVRITGNGINVRSGPKASEKTIAALSSTDSVDYVARVNDQWSRVSLRDGREGFVSNQFLLGIAYAAPKPAHAPKRLQKAKRPATKVDATRPAPVEELSSVSSLSTAPPQAVPAELATVDQTFAEQSTPSAPVTVSPPTSSGYSGSRYSGYHDIQTGPRGGHYYINSHGNKTYVRRK